MFTAIGLMLTGIALGFALRSFQWPELLGRAISPTIMLMLFALGVAVGGNETLMTNLPVLGGKHLSLICIVAVRRFFPDAGPRRHAAAGADSEDAGAAMSVRRDREDGEGRA